MATVLLEARPYRPFKSSEEYLYAMREDLAEWMNTMYPDLRINVDNFMDRLDTGVALCKVSWICIHFSISCTTAEKHISFSDKICNAAICYYMIFMQWHNALARFTTQLAGREYSPKIKHVYFFRFCICFSLMRLFTFTNHQIKLIERIF